MTLSSSFSESDWLAYTFDNLKVGGIWGWPKARLRYKKINENTVELYGVGPFAHSNWKEAHEWVVKHSDKYNVKDSHRLYGDNNE